jgi:hypothetical protein
LPTHQATVTSNFWLQTSNLTGAIVSAVTY